MKNRKLIFTRTSLFTGISYSFFLLVLCLGVGCKQDSLRDDKQQVLYVLKEYYKGITKRDTNLFYLNSTNNFVLYEQGKVMDNQMFSKLIMDLDQEIKTEYEFNDIKINLNHDFAHAFYKTTGKVSRNNSTEKRQYLESTLLIKE